MNESQRIALEGLAQTSREIEALDEENAPEGAIRVFVKKGGKFERVTVYEQAWEALRTVQQPEQQPVTVTVAMVIKLRDETNEPTMECRKALYACNGNHEEAKEWLRLGRRLCYRI